MPPAVNDITDVAAVKAVIKILSAADDAIVQAFISGVSTLFENYCNTKFIDLAIVDILDGSGTDKQLLRYPPARTITEIKFEFDTATPTTMVVADFVLNGPAGILRSPGGIFTEGFQNIQVKYTCGYGAAIANLPDDIKMAAILQVEFLYKRDTADFSTTMGEGFVIKADPKDFAPGVRVLLDAYKRTVL